MNKFEYKNPVLLHFGVDVLANISEHVNNRTALLVTSTGFLKRGTAKQLEESLSTNCVGIVSNITPNPDIIDLKTIYSSIENLEFEIIIALGGGSVIDASKVLSLLNKETSFSQIEAIIKGKNLNSAPKTKPIIAIPTTAGTGSELTPWATVWDMAEKKKYSLHLKSLFPEVALCDPRLTLTVPLDITVQTALDTLSHSLESIWNKNVSPVSKVFAINASKIILKFLPLLLNDLKNLEYREKIMLACIYAGKAFSNTATSTAHAMSYYITANKGVAHGLACSFTIPALITCLIGKFPWLDEIFLEIFGELSAEPIKLFFNEIKISTRISDYDLSNEDLQKIENSLETNIRAANGIVDVSQLMTTLRSEEFC